MTLIPLLSFVAVPLTVVVTFAILVAAARPDRGDGDGIYATYVALASVVVIYLLLLLGTVLVQSIAAEALVDQPIPESDIVVTSISAGWTAAPGRSGNGAQIAGSAAAVAAAGVILGFHLGRRRELAERDGFAGSAADRVDRAYLATVCVTTLSLAVVAALGTGFGVAEVVDPRASAVTDESIRQQAWTIVIAQGALMVACALLFRSHFWAIREDNAPAETAEQP